jgi:quaternary ammonium compound-resistance protein SugE
MNLYWIVLFAAVFVEIAWALSLKFIQTHPGPGPIAASVVLTALNMLLLSYAMRGLPVGTAYAVWTGLGAVGIAILGAVFFDDPMTMARAGFIALIIAGVAGLKLSS